MEVDISIATAIIAPLMASNAFFISRLVKKIDESAEHISMLKKNVAVLQRDCEIVLSFMLHEKKNGESKPFFYNELSEEE